MARKKAAKTHSLVADVNAFKFLGEVRMDSKKRVVLKGRVHKHYFAYQDDEGKILLDPMELVPAREAWLYKNPKALSSLRQGLKDARDGRITKLPSLEKFAEEPLDD